MTKQELMDKRVLSEDVVSLVADSFLFPDIDKEQEIDDLVPDDEGEWEDCDFISPQYIQRLPPEEIVERLISRGEAPYSPIKSYKDIICVLSAATGRSELDLYETIFGTGSYTPKPRVFPPSDAQKSFMKTWFKILHLNASGILRLEDEKSWPDDIRKEWDEAWEKTPHYENSRKEFTTECIDLAKYYFKHGLPDWLTDDDDTKES